MPDDSLVKMKGNLRRHMSPGYVQSMDRMPAPFSPEEDALIEAEEIERAVNPLDVENYRTPQLWPGFRSSGGI